MRCSRIAFFLLLCDFLCTLDRFAVSGQFGGWADNSVETSEKKIP